MGAADMLVLKVVVESMVGEATGMGGRSSARERRGATRSDRHRRLLATSRRQRRFEAMTEVPLRAGIIHEAAWRLRNGPGKGGCR